MPAQPPLVTPTRTPRYLPSASSMIWRRRTAAASVRRTGLGRSRRGRRASVILSSSYSEAVGHKTKLPSIHVQFELGFFTHAVRRPGRIEGHVDRDLADAFHLFQRRLDIARHFAGDRAVGGG